MVAKLRLTPAEVHQVEAALKANARPDPQLAALIRDVRAAQRGTYRAPA